VTGEIKMSGEAFVEIEKINICPCCDKEAQICYIQLYDEDYLQIKFNHPQITNSANPEWFCEAQDESGGYVVKIPLNKNDQSDRVGFNPLTHLSPFYFSLPFTQSSLYYNHIIATKPLYTIETIGVLVRYVSKRSKNPNLKKEILYDLYINKGLTIEKIAKTISSSYKIVRNRLLEFNIPIRSSTEHLTNKPIELRGELVEIINGHLLGDGCIPLARRDINNEKTNCHFSFVSKYHNYVKLVAENLKTLEPKIFKTKQNVKFPQDDFYTPTTTYQLHTKRLLSRSLRDKWYPNGIKAIPKDIKLTPLTCLYWYIDDGSLEKVGGRIQLSTMSFKEIELITLILPQLEKILNAESGEIKIYIERGRYPKIHIPRRFVERFLNYIGECPIEEYDYKWKAAKYFKPYLAQRHRFWSEEELKLIDNEYAKGIEYLMEKTGRSYNAIKNKKYKRNKTYGTYNNNGTVYKGDNDD
jgi:hypothetical protein